MENKSSRSELLIKIDLMIDCLSFDNTETRIQIENSQCNRPKPVSLKESK